MGSFDVIAGMDWLTFNRAEFVCFKRFIRIPLENGRILNVYCDTPTSKINLMSCFQDQRYLRKKCAAFLTQVVEKERKEKKISDILVVRNFPNVFPDDVTGLSLIRQVEFRIDLIPGANSVAKAPYILAPFERKELSSQLQELSDKGFIPPSSSHWGAPVLFVKKKDGSFRMCID
ncbi:uncharacterized protein LOC143572324 [Bidens hawaiensis]|uniref:uncharacterized protein LOC143572324 n=1 Tax=Bidens hawaiensis TaxID=980011 RepID=UPI00404AA9D0